MEAASFSVPEPTETRVCKGCGADFPVERKPGRPRQYCYGCKPSAGLRAVPEPATPEIPAEDDHAHCATFGECWQDREPCPHGLPAPISREGVVEYPADKLRDRAMEIDQEAALLVAQAEQMRVDAARLRSKAERMDDPSRGVQITVRAIDRARDDGLLAAAAVAAETLPAPFTSGDLADALGVDTQRGTRAALALHELGKLARAGDRQWTVIDADEAAVRDYIADNDGAFTLGDMIVTLELSEQDALEYVDLFMRRGVIDGEAGHYHYVETGPHSAPRPRRRPPEQDPPAGSERRAKGEPVRVVNHGKRGKAMQGGNRRAFIRRDQNRERAEESRDRKTAERAAARAQSDKGTKVRRK